MRPTRRGFIKTVAFGILGTELFPNFPTNVFAKPNSYENGIEIQKGFIIFNNETQKSMEALAEALLPGSKEIGIRNLFMNYVNRNHGLGGYYDSGIWYTDTLSKNQFKKPFYALSKNEKDKIVTSLSTRKKKLYSNFRKLIIQLYYSQPTTWKTLSYEGPPQPKGFMNYSEPTTK